MELYKLGKIPWEETQLLYHSLALLGKEALCLVSPVTPYVCIGYHQDVDREVDLEFCHKENIPVFRREVGGGAVFLDGSQLFFQLILKQDNPIVPKKIDLFYKKFLQPVIDVHHEMGIPAIYKPVNDLVVGSRKISGTGAGEIGECIVFVGNLILDFNYETMSRVLKIPDEKFRHKVKKSIEDNLSTIRRELGGENADRWNERTLNDMIAERFSNLLGPMTIRKKDTLLLNKMEALRKVMMHDRWFYHKGKRVDGRIIKIKSGLEIVQKIHKATGGLIRAEFSIENDCYKEVAISGDYFCFPKDTVNRLERKIEGSFVSSITGTITKFYKKETFELPGIKPDDWITVFKIY